MPSPATPSSISFTSDERFAADVGPGTGVVAVKFSAAWCASCRVLAPVVEEAARTFAARLRVLEVDADANPEATARFAVRGLPTTLIFHDGELVDRVTGAVSKSTFFARIESQLRP